MTNKEMKEKLDMTTKELFPDIKLKFGTNDYYQLNVFVSHIRIESSVFVDRSEIIHNEIFNRSKLKNILKIRVKNALLELQNFVQDGLNKLEKL